MVAILGCSGLNEFFSTGRIASLTFCNSYYSYPEEKRDSHRDGAALSRSVRDAFTWPYSGTRILKFASFGYHCMVLNPEVWPWLFFDVIMVEITASNNVVFVPSPSIFF